MVGELDDRERRLRRGRRRERQRRRPREPGRRGAGRQALQRDPALRDQEEGVATSTSSRTRRASACASASTASSRRRCGRRSSCATRSRRASRSWRRSTSPSAACRRTAASSSRSAATARWTSACQRAADAVRREDRHASPRQGEPAARHDEARLRSGAARRLQGRDQEAVRHGARHGPDRFGQDDDALLGAVRAQHDRSQHLAPPRTRSSTTCTASTRCRCTRTSA